MRDERLIELYENDRLVGCFPCTPGSRQVPVPQGTWKITSNVLMPHFRWDKSVLELGVRSYNCLKRVGVETIGDLISKTEAELSAIPNFGKKSIEEVKENLAAHGLGLRSDDE